MNKTISINLGGSVFNIEERAYDQLKAYLDQIRKNLEEPEMSDEVMSDIELRIAELFKERMTAIKNVVVDEDVEHIITVMGRPEDYGSGHKGEQSEFKRHDHRYDNQGHKSRRIFRDSDDAIVGGVCSGLSHYIGWDPLVLRVIAVLVGFISFGSAFIGYIIFWALIPEARTTPEKLQMRGESVNIENISRFVNEEAARASQNINKATRRFSASTAGVAKGAGVVFTKIVGAMLSFVGIGMLIALMIALTAADSHVFEWSGSDLGFFNTYVWSDPAMGIWILVALVLVMGAPALGMLYSGIRLLMSTTKRIPFLGSCLVGLFIVGVIIAFWAGSNIAREFSRHAEFKTDLTWPTRETGDTLYVSVMENPHFLGRNERQRSISDLVKEEGDSVYYGEPISVQFEPASSNQFAIRIVRKSEGRDLHQAGGFANNIQYDYHISGNQLELASVFSSPKGDLYRGQHIDIIVYVPMGKKVHMGKNISWLSWFDENEENRVYTMCEERLEESCQRIPAHDNEEWDAEEEVDTKEEEKQ